MDPLGSMTKDLSMISPSCRVHISQCDEAGLNFRLEIGRSSCHSEPDAGTRSGF